MTALLGSGIVVLYHLPGMQEPSFETDKAQLQQTKERLTAVMAEFDTLPLPDGVTGKDARYSGCGTESGGLYQPYVSGELSVPSLAAVPAARAVAEVFRERGWTASPDGSHGYKLAADRGDWRLMGWISASSTGDSVWLQARIDGPGPCRLGSESRDCSKTPSRAASASIASLKPHPARLLGKNRVLHGEGECRDVGRDLR
jgi:hypothetical protein